MKVDTSLRISSEEVEREFIQNNSKIKQAGAWIGHVLWLVVYVYEPGQKKYVLCGKLDSVLCEGKA
ncbi:hypothetical protein M3201_22590 [Paenibacillus motobuensis]|uniref:hypothetical protein n=1 Tax=Paenibacillus TaxID=44249 RepID=UPI00203D3DD2|nr:MULTISPECIES: hypothetical protein [Paenibacillus]MCM3042448.1 hypothetical protein [Paenibacillus lutimineralis]MCM3649552.1 hypothetical protein [Paenibacillus motobuensis]